MMNEFFFSACNFKSLAAKSSEKTASNHFLYAHTLKQQKRNEGNSRFNQDFLWHSLNGYLGWLRLQSGKRITTSAMTSSARNTWIIENILKSHIYSILITILWKNFNEYWKENYLFTIFMRVSHLHNMRWRKTRRNLYVYFFKK